MSDWWQSDHTTNMHMNTHSKTSSRFQNMKHRKGTWLVPTFSSLWSSDKPVLLLKRRERRDFPSGHDSIDRIILPPANFEIKWRSFRQVFAARQILFAAPPLHFSRPTAWPTSFNVAMPASECTACHPHLRNCRQGPYSDNNTSNSTALHYWRLPFLSQSSHFCLCPISHLWALGSALGSLPRLQTAFWGSNS